jgi:methyltransferase family protein
MPRARPATADRLRSQAQRAIASAESGRSRLPPAVLALEGYSSPTVRHFLNNLCRFAGANYLEVGTWKGSTLMSAAYANSGRFTAVDDFSHHVVSRSEGRAARETLRRVRRRFGRECHVHFHESDCWAPALLRRLPPGVNVYFYDGRHTYEDQYRAFTHFEPLLAPRYLAVVDDWNRPYVRAATREALGDLGHQLVWEREMFTRGWFRQQATGEWPTPHWFNGIFVAVVSKPRERHR